MNEEDKIIPPELVWKEIKDDTSVHTARARVYGGWLVKCRWARDSVTVTYIPDEYQNWNIR